MTALSFIEAELADGFFFPGEYESEKYGSDFALLEELNQPPQEAEEAHLDFAHDLDEDDEDLTTLFLGDDDGIPF